MDQPKPSNEELVKALKACLVHLSSTTRCSENGKTEYICIALDIARFRRGAEFDAVHYLQALILERIGPHGSFSGWLQCVSGVIEREVDKDYTHNAGRKIQAHRKAWVHRLIIEFGGTP